MSVLDVGCGAGFLTNALAGAGHEVTGLDASAEALAVAAARDWSKRVTYETGDATKLPYADASFDVVSAMDLLEHVEQPARVVAELARVLRPGGLCFFHTFDRTFLAWLLVIKGVQLVFRGSPADIHVLRLFIRPAELGRWLEQHGLAVEALQGSRPVVNGAFLRLVATGHASDDVRFTFTRSTAMGYTGFARKKA